MSVCVLGRVERGAGSGIREAGLFQRMNPIGFFLHVRWSRSPAQVRLPVCVYCFNKFIHLKGRAGMRLVAGGYRTLRLLLSFDMKVIIFPLAAAGLKAAPPPQSTLPHHLFSAQRVIRHYRFPVIWNHINFLQ